MEEMVEEGHLAPPADPDPGVPPEERLDAHWGTVLAQALKEELDCLCARDRLLLNLYYVDSVPLKAIGRHFGVHEATASRWLERLRRSLRKRVEHKMRKAHGLSARELETLWHWVSEAELPMLNAVRTVSGKKPQCREKVQGEIV